MNKFCLYLIVYPSEALVASTLSAEEFASYLAVGPQHLSSGQLIFLEVDPQLKSSHFDLEYARRRCEQHTTGESKRSVYLSIYRSMELLPLEAFGTLHLVTKDGRTLPIAPQPEFPPETGEPPFLYQEICPVRPLIASTLSPVEFLRFMTSHQSPIHVPRLLFCDLQRGEKKDRYFDETLPYRQIEHIRSCLEEVMADRPGNPKRTKTVGRTGQDDFLYRTIARGFFLGDSATKKFYPIPNREVLRAHHYPWLRSALMD